MFKLKPIPATELTTYVVELLGKYNIKTVSDFLNADKEDISRKANLSKIVVEEIRAKLLGVFKPPAVNLLIQYKKDQCRRKFFGFGIKSCDELLTGQQQFCNDSVFEIFGVAAIGKTQFCLTVALNIIENWKTDVLYIDTKQDFSANRFYHLMRSRNIERSVCGQIMQRVKVERTMTLQGVLNVLQNFDILYKKRDACVSAVKLIIIDAIPAVWFIQNSDDERFLRKHILSQIANIVHKIANEHYVATLMVNLAVQNEEQYAENQDLQDLSNPRPSKRRRSTEDSITNEITLKPSLGRYWLSIPNTRLLMKLPEGVDEDSKERIIEVTRNSYGPIAGCCRVCITDAGVVS